MHHHTFGGSFRVSRLYYLANNVVATNLPALFVYGLEWVKCGVRYNMSEKEFAIEAMSAAVTSNAPATVEVLLKKYPQLGPSLPMRQEFTVMAAQHGCTAVMRVLLAHEMPVNENAICLAAANGHIPILELIVAASERPLPRVAMTAAIGGLHVETVHWLHVTAGIPFESNDIYALWAKPGDRARACAVLKEMLDGDIPSAAFMATEVIHHSNTACLDLLLQRDGHRFDAKRVRGAAITSGNLDIVGTVGQFYNHEGWTETHLLEAVVEGNYPVTDYLCATGGVTCKNNLAFAAEVTTRLTDWLDGFVCAKHSHLHGGCACREHIEDETQYCLDRVWE